MSTVIRLRKDASLKLGKWNHESFLAKSSAVARIIESGRATEAVEAARSLLERCMIADESAYDEAPYDAAVAYFRLGSALKKSGRFKAAFSPLAEARRRFLNLTTTDSLVDRMVGITVKEIGDCLSNVGRLDDALKLYQEAAVLAEKVGDKRAEAVAKAELGNVRRLQRRFEEAIAINTETLRIFEDLGEPTGVATAWIHLCRVYQDADDLDSAENASQEALRVFVRLGDQHAQAHTLNDLGAVYARMGRSEEAARVFRQAVDIYMRLNDIAMEGKSRTNMAHVLVSLGRHAEARHEIQQAIECSRHTDDEEATWRAFRELFNLEQAVDDRAAACSAREKLTRAFQAYRRSGGENHQLSGQMALMVRQAFATGQTAKLIYQIEETLKSPDMVAETRLYTSALREILMGSRDLTLASNPEMEYSCAVELTLLLETLEESSSSRDQTAASAGRHR